MVPDATPSPPPLGLCATCVAGELRRSPRAVFLRCARADRDPAFPRYPRLPVLACPGWERGPGIPEGGGGDDAPDRGPA